MSKYSYGCIPDIADFRDHKLSLTAPITLPPVSDITPLMPPVYDQSTCGSCTGNGIAAAIEYDLIKQGLPVFIPSRLFIYYNERVIENTVNSDSGAMIRDGIKSVASLGVCSEIEWPYDVNQFAVKPSDKCYTDAVQNVITSYSRVNQDLYSLKAVLANKFPIVAGISVYESFENAEAGIIPMPQPSERLLGGHCVLVVGYDDTKNVFIVRNSWGPNWGNKGYFTIPYDYLTNSDLASDFWVINFVK